MKTTITTLISLFVFIAISQAQELTKDISLAIKNDNISALKSQITPEEYNLCFSAKETQYALLSLTIKANATACFDFLMMQELVDTNINCTGKTPLIYTAKYGQLEMLKKLIKNGADQTIKNKGRSVLDYAKKYEHQEIVDFLENK